MTALPDLVGGGRVGAATAAIAACGPSGACAARTRCAAAARIDVLGVSVFRLSNEGFLEERLYWDSAFCAQPPRDAGAS